MVGDDYCIDFAGASMPRDSADPACETGGDCFVSLGLDAVTYATRDAASGGTDAPDNLTSAQLAKIYECKDTNWKQVGGPNAQIEAYLPYTGDGTRDYFLVALGGGQEAITPGSCVSDLATPSNPGGTLASNEGINPALDSPEAIAPYSVAAYIAQGYHSAACTKADCAEVGPTTLPCKPTGSENRFSCAENGVLGLNEINGIAPAKPWPLPAPPASPVINTKFPRPFQYVVSDVVRYDGDTADRIPPGLEPMFAAKTASSPGFACTSAKARKDIEDYGFLPSFPRLGACGDVG
jgi:ABC-type phosphate transport system substrate-binding protein